MKLDFSCLSMVTSDHIDILGRNVMSANKLATYRKRRNFKKTPEPRGKTHAVKKQLIFVIQKHAAHALHYDMRLEIDGVLVSWAVPKGPSTDSSEKRLAIQTEDHPLEYAQFEGVIPQGQYGGGTVMVWDLGTYRNIKKVNGKLKSMSDCLRDGQIEVWFDGKKLRGGYVFIRFKEKERDWLLKKIEDENANAHVDILISKPNSALTGRTMEQIKEESAI